MTAYEYTSFRIERGGWRTLADDIEGIDEAARQVGGSVFLLCAGMIGFASDEGALIRTWPDAAALERESATNIVISGVFQEWNSELLTATLRPVNTTPPSRPGVYAHRWFSLQHEHINEFQSLSERGIWPYFESDGCEIIGLWRGADEHGLARLLLITRYPNVAHWERTRLQSSETPPGADPNLYRQAQEAARRRAAITDRSIVRLTRIVLSSGS